jgi:hypothetical protein
MLSATLPRRVAAMGVKSLSYSTEVVRTDGGAVHANSRWEEPLATWSFTTAPMKRNDADYLDTKALFDAALGSADTFLFHDVEECADVEVRFREDTMGFQPEGNLVRLVFEVEEVRS